MSCAPISDNISVHSTLLLAFQELLIIIDTVIWVLFYAVLELLPISVVFGVVILADISLTSGIAYSTIFVAQMLYSISFTVNGAIKEIEGFSYVDYLYGIVDLNFQYVSFCLWAGATTLDVLVMKICFDGLCNAASDLCSAASQLLQLRQIEQVLSS